jgi:glucokinase
LSPLQTSLRASLEIGGTKLQWAVGDPQGHIQECRRCPVDPSQGAEGIRQQIQNSLPPFLKSFQPAALGVGFGGPLDRHTGQISRSHQIPGWAGFDLKRWLEDLTGLTVLADNDANVAALGEARLGAGRNRDPVFYVTLGSGVGGGLVVDGAIYHGTVPGESEIGHLRLDQQGTRVEERCSGWAVDEKIRRLARARPEGFLAKLVRESPGHEARHLARALREMDAEAAVILAEAVRDLAFALSHVTHLFHPERIVLGGGLALVGEPLREAVAAALPPLLMEVFRPGPDIRLAELGEKAVPTGGLLLAALLG